MEWTCAKCATANGDDSRFCKQCGAARPGKPATGASAADSAIARARSRRILTALLVGAIVFAMLTIVAAVSFKRWWNSRPEFAVRQVGVSVANSDLDTVRQHMDIDSVARGVVDDAFEVGLDKIWETRGPRGAAVAERAAERGRESAVDRVREGIEKFVRAGGPLPDATADLAEQRAIRAMRAFFGSCAKSPKAVAMEGDRCRVTTTIDDEQGRPIDFELDVRQTAAGWRIVRILNGKQIIEERMKIAAER